MLARALLGLVGSAHPVPSAAVTVLATVMSAVAGRSAGGCALVAAAVLTGQLSIGWCNDLVDREPRPGRRAHRQAAGHRGRPAAAGRGRLRRSRPRPACRSRWPAAGGPGVAHLVGVAGGWAYDLGVKRTVWSWLPYAGSFALLTAFVTLGLPGHPAPPAWLVVAGALLGTGAHFLNVVPDVEADLAAGVRGLPQRLGRGAGGRGGSRPARRRGAWSSPSAPGGRRGGPGPGSASPPAARPAPG